jgi:type IX secretion system PorP/SprF family membrane protein
MSAVLLSAMGSYAQDAHFTQYFSSPLTLNPALTGLVNCDLRVAGNYRNQWSSVSTPYTTATLSYDMNLLKGKFTNGDRIGLGVMALYDKSGQGALTNVTFALSGAYHKAFGGTFDGESKNHTLSVGIQGGIVQKTIDQTKLILGDQFDPSSGFTNIPSKDLIGNNDVNYADFSAGLTYTGRITERATAYAGFSTYHLTTPTESFLNSDSTKIHRRYTAFLGGSFQLNENIWLYASSLYQNQAKASEFVLGSAVGFVLNPGFDQEFSRPTILYTGAWYRFNDAICPYVALDFKKATIGFSYDVNISNFAPATNSNGAYEISLIYNGCITKRSREPRQNFSCPKF